MSATDEINRAIRELRSALHDVESAVDQIKEVAGPELNLENAGLKECLELGYALITEKYGHTSPEAAGVRAVMSQLK